MSTQVDVIDEYLKHIRVDQRSELERIRKVIAAMVPEAEEVISYGMPAFKYKKKYLVGYGAYTDHLSIFPTPQPIEALKPKLEGYKLAKGTVQFTIDQPLPDALLREIITERIREINAN